MVVSQDDLAPREAAIIIRHNPLDVSVDLDQAGRQPSFREPQAAAKPNKFPSGGAWALRNPSAASPLASRTTRRLLATKGDINRVSYLPQTFHNGVV